MARDDGDGWRDAGNERVLVRVLVYSHAFYRVTKLTNKRSSIIPREDRVDVIDQHVSLAR